MNVASFIEWVPCTAAESWLFGLNPYIPWPHDRNPQIVDRCHVQLRTLVEEVGWAGARKCPEVMRLSRRPDDLMVEILLAIRDRQKAKR